MIRPSHFAQDLMTGTLELARRALVTAMVLGIGTMTPYPSWAQLAAADSATRVYTAPNNVPVVDIAKANSAGLSHNRFNDYNVDSRGVVLNNGNFDKLTRDSQLAGSVPANANLTKEANVILNEVVTTNRSSLKGYTEVVGKNADVIVANPNGITCNGCGFINTPNVTLTTGAPQIDGNGALKGFRVDKGDILVTGNGLNATNQDYLALVSRSAKIDAQINAKTLDIVTGVNDFDQATKTATPRTANGDAPAYAVDSSALGGMYANKIRLVATEAGVGVRMLGEAASGVDDFTIDAAGNVELGNKISSGHDVKITSTAGGANAIKATNAGLSAKNNLTLTAANGQVHLSGGVVTAAHDLSVSSASLMDEQSTDTATDNNKRYAGNHLDLTQSGATSLNGTTYGAGAAFHATADSFTVGSDGAVLYSDTTLGLTTVNAMNLGHAGLKSQDDLSLSSTNGGITTTAGSGQGPAKRQW